MQFNVISAQKLLHFELMNELNAEQHLVWRPLSAQLPPDPSGVDQQSLTFIPPFSSIFPSFGLLPSPFSSFTWSSLLLIFLFGSDVFGQKNISFLCLFPKVLNHFFIMYIMKWVKIHALLSFEKSFFGHFVMFISFSAPFWLFFYGCFRQSVGDKNPLKE